MNVCVCLWSYTIEPCGPSIKISLGTLNPTQRQYYTPGRKKTEGMREGKKGRKDKSSLKKDKGN